MTQNVIVPSMAIGGLFNGVCVAGRDCNCFGLNCFPLTNEWCACLPASCLYVWIAIYVGVRGVSFLCRSLWGVYGSTEEEMNGMDDSVRADRQTA